MFYNESNKFQGGIAWILFEHFCLHNYVYLSLIKMYELEVLVQHMIYHI